MTSKEPPSRDGVGVALPVVNIDNRQALDIGDVSRWSELAGRALAHEGVPARSEVGLAFVSVDEMTALNREHMAGDGPTDVLAFPIDGWTEGAIDGGSVAVTDPPIMLGDIVVCPQIAARATSSSRSLVDELALLIVHGGLHLIGHDHFDPTERADMQARERELLDRFHAVGQAAR